ncbi:MAG: metal-dependent transcriptional regulator [Thermomicrobiales bacterium]
MSTDRLIDKRATIRMEEHIELSPHVTHAMEDYLKAVYRIIESGKPATTQALAEELAITGPSVTNMIKRLHAMRLLTHTRYQGVELTPAGERIALEVIRHHRLLELYLAETLGYRWDEVHDEAEKLEHLVSDDLEARMDSALGFPTRDPHGDPIPAADGSVSAEAGTLLREVAANQRVRVIRVSDRDPELLRYLGAMDLVPGTEVTVIARVPFDDLIRLDIGGIDHVVGPQVAEAVFVVAADTAAAEPEIVCESHDS